MKLKTVPLKFRIWDTKQKRLRQVAEIDFKLKEIVPVDGNDVVPFSEAIISQDTGLKDKNGKSIYTGGIVAGRSFRAIVVYKNGHVQFQAPDGGQWMVEPQRVEVIGNIWENSNSGNKEQ